MPVSGPVKTGVEITSVEPTTEGFIVRFRHQGRDATIIAERVANGAGRMADGEDLDLQAGNVRRDGERILVGQSLRGVSNPKVYVAGDPLWSTPHLSPVATYEGQRHASRTWISR
jgi:glutathione reductase (NADPH)